MQMLVKNALPKVADCLVSSCTISHSFCALHHAHHLMAGLMKPALVQQSLRDIARLDLQLEPWSNGSRKRKPRPDRSVCHHHTLGCRSGPCTACMCDTVCYMLLARPQSVLDAHDCTTVLWQAALCRRLQYQPPSKQRAK